MKFVTALIISMTVALFVAHLLLFVELSLWVFAVASNNGDLQDRLQCCFEDGVTTRRILILGAWSLPLYLYYRRRRKRQIGLPELLGLLWIYQVILWYFVPFLVEIVES